MKVRVAGAWVATAAVVAAIIAAGGPGGGGGEPTPTPTATPTATAVSCDLNATTSNFTSQLAAATTGQVLCLATGDYGTFTGTNKAITIAAAEGATPEMQICFGSGDTGFTLDGMQDMSGDIGRESCSGGATNITIRNSAFTDSIWIDGAGTDGIVLDGNTHNWLVGPSAGPVPNAKIKLASGLTGTVSSPSVTVKNSEIRNGDLDAVHLDGGTMGVRVEDNEMSDICFKGEPYNHSDFIQFDTTDTSEVLIAGNYMWVQPGCAAEGIVSYDSGTVGVIIEDNVIDIFRAWGIELFSDEDSIVRHNTVRYRAAHASINDDTRCEFFNISCGRIKVDAKDEDPDGSGTEIYDNIATQIETVNGSTAITHHNGCRQTGCTGTGALNSMTPVFVGGTAPTTYDGYCLAPGSPGKNAASDGLDMGIRC